MVNKSNPYLSKGSVNNAVSGIVYRERGHLQNETTKAHHLKQVRAYPANHGGLVKPYSDVTVRKIGSDANVQAYREQMQALRDEISGTRRRFSGISALPLQRSILKNTVRAVAHVGRESVLAGLLSMPKNTPNLKRAMQAPYRAKNPKGSGRYSAAELLGKGKIEARKFSFVLEHAAYLRERAQQQLEHGPAARKGEFDARLEFLKPRRNALHDAMATLGKAKQSLTEASTNVEKLQRAWDQKIADLTEKRKRLETNVQELQQGIFEADQARKILRQEIKDPHEQLADAESDIWLPIFRHASLKGFDAPPDEAVRNEVQRHQSRIKELNEKIEKKNGLVRSHTKKINTQRITLNNLKNELIATRDEIESLQDEHGSEAQQILQAVERFEQLDDEYQASVANLRGVLNALATDGSGTSEYQRTLNERIAKIRGDHGNNATDPGSPSDDATLALAQEMSELLNTKFNDILSELEKPDSDLARDLKDGAENVHLAQKLVDELKASIDEARKEDTPDETAVANKIEALDAFALDQGSDELGEQLGALFNRLREQPAPTEEELDNKAVFDLVYDAASDLTKDPTQKTDAALAAKVLTELLQPERTLSSLIKGGLSEEAQELVQKLAVLPRGMEVLKRIIAHDDIAAAAQNKGKRKETELPPDGKQRKLDALQRTVALQTYLRAANERSKLDQYGMLNDSTQQLLQAAQDAAGKLYDDPGYALSDAARAAFSAVRNRLISHVGYVSDLMTKFRDEWIPRGLERDNTTGDRTGQGRKTGIGKMKHVFPTTGKTPLNKKTLAATDRTATGYAGRELVITGGRLDEDLTKTGNDLRKSVVGLLKNGVSPADMEQLLISVAAADVARERIAAATENGSGLRPEHCIVGGQISREDFLKAVTTAVTNAFSAANLLNNELEIAAIALSISNSVGTEMLKGAYSGTNDLLAVARQAARAAMWDIQATIDEESAFLEKLDIAGALNAIAEISAPEDIEAVKAKLAQLRDDAELNPGGEQATLMDEIAQKLAYPLPPTASVPLKAENLIQCNDHLQECVRKEDLNEATKVVVKETAGGAKNLKQLIDTSAPKLNSVRDIYNYLAARLEQIEIPGRQRMTSGGVLGVSTKGISDAISKTKWIAGLAGVAPRLRLEGLAGKNAAIELVFSSVGMEIWIGKEKKKSAAAGGGVGGSLGITEAKGSASADKTAMLESTLHEGVKFMIPRSRPNRTEEYSEREMRQEAKKLLHALLFGPPEKTGVDTHDADSKDTNSDEVSGLPENLAAVLAACPHVSVAVLGTMSDTYVKQESVGNLGFSSRGGLASHGRSLGASFGLGRKNTRLDWREYNLSEQTGRTNVERHNIFSGGYAALNSSLGPSAAVASFGEDVTHSLGASLSGGSTSRQFKVDGADVKLRLAIHDGKIDPSYTRREFEHATTATLRRNFEAKREQWIKVGVELLFMKPEDKEIPIEEKRRFAIRSLEAALRMCEEADRDPKGGKNLRNVFAETYRLRNGAASQLDGIRSKEALQDARIEKLEHYIRNTTKGDADAAAKLKNARKALQEAMEEKVKLIDAQNAIYREDGSWQPWKISATERTYETAEDGIDVLFKMGGTNVAESQRPVFFWPY